MSLQIRFRIPITRNLWLNVSRSGLSLSARAGRVTINSRGSIWVRIARGIGWRKG